MARLEVALLSPKVGCGLIAINFTVEREWQPPPMAAIGETFENMGFNPKATRSMTAG
jgi:hypothetical protein